jgi:hypothetical protein
LEREMRDADDRSESPVGGGALSTSSPNLGEDHATTGCPSPDDSQAVDESTVRRIEHLPKEVGVMLVSVGTLGLVLPGLMGTPALIAGGLVLWPGTFSRVDGWLRRRNPGLYHRGMKQLGRFLDDLERRYPELSKK